MDTSATTRKERWLAWAGLLLALVFYFFSVLRVDYARSSLLNLDPGPDAIEYQALATSLLATGRPVISINGEALPSRYPAGWPVLTLPWTAALPEDQRILGPFRTNQTLGLFFILGGFGWFYASRRPVFAGALALLVATLPAYALFARSGMSELSAGIFVAAACLLIHEGSRRQSRGCIYAAAAVLGLAVNVRLNLIFFAPGLLAMALISPRGTWRGWLVHNLGTLVVFFACAAPTLCLNALQFGHPLHTGYHFWVPAVTAPGETFALRHLPGNLRMLRDEFCMQGGFKVAHLFGSGCYWVFPYVLLAVLGLRGFRPAAAHFGLLLGAAVFFLSSLFYFFHQDARLYFPLVLTLAIPAARAVCQAWRNRTHPSHRVRTCVVFGLFGLALAGYPGGVSYPLRPFSSVSLHALKWPLRFNSADNFLAAREFRRLPPASSALVLSDISPVYLSALLPATHRAAPIDGRHGYEFSKTWRYGPAEALAAAQQAVLQNRTVYVLQNVHEGPLTDETRFPAPAGWRWRARERTKDQNAFIWELMPIAPIDEDRASR